MQVNSASVKKAYTDGAVNQCTKVQNDHVLQGWIEFQSNGDDMTDVGDVKTNTTSYYRYNLPKLCYNQDTHLSVEVDSIYVYNCYGYWSPDW